LIISRPLLRITKVSNKICREIQNKNFVLNNLFFPKIVPFMRWCGRKTRYSQASHRWQYGACTYLAR